MTIWRLEWLRLLRTRRLLAIVGIYVFFGLTGPLAARFVREIIGMVDTQGMKIEVPPPVPADGITQFSSNANQLGLLIVVLVAASALAFDARREMAVFLRTRVRRVSAIILPAYFVVSGGAALGLILGALSAWYETTVLIGAVPTGSMLVGIACGVLVLAFAVAVVALMAALVRGVLMAAGCALVLLIGLAVVRGLTGGPAWLPVALTGALHELVRGAPVSQFVPAIVVTAVLTALSLAAAVMLGERREI